MNKVWLSLSSKPYAVQPARRPTPDVQYNCTSPSAQLDDTVKSPSKSPPPISRHTSPHDVVLARMRGLPTPADGTDAKNHPESLQADDLPQVAQAADSVDAPSPSSVSLSTANNPAGPREVLHDPFDGSPIGLLAANTQGRQSQQQPSSIRGDVRAPEGGSRDEDLWVHLSRVLDLQNQVAKMHLEMESVRPSVGKSKASGRGPARKTAKGKAGSDDHSDNVVEGIDVEAEDAHEGDEEGVEVEGDEEAERKKAREAEFAGLADHFEGRNESINAIMGRLDLLSKALTEYHALQTPAVEFPRSSSRPNTTSPEGVTPSTIHSTLSSAMTSSLPNAGTTSIPNSNVLRPSVPTQGDTLSGARHSFLRNSILPVSLSRADARSSKGKNPIAPLTINTVELGQQTHMMDSPASMGRSEWDSKPTSDQGATSASEPLAR